MEIKKIVLASSSPRRLELLKQIGITPEVIVSDAETEISEGDPEDIVMDLATLKARDVARKAGPGTVVIGADTIVAIGTTILGKPSSHEDAARMLKSIEGRMHHVYTGVCMIYRGTEGDMENVFYDETGVQIVSMSDEEINAYAALDEPMDKAGSYAVQGIFARYIKSINGSYANVMGLPVSLVWQGLKELYEYTDEDMDEDEEPSD